MKALSIFISLLVSSCLPVGNKTSLKSEADSENILDYKDLKSCYENIEPVFYGRYNKDNEYDLYESLSYYKDGDKEYLISSSERKSHVYKN